MTTTIQIKGINEAIGKTGKKYWKVDTDKGLMSAFDEPVIDKLKEAWKNNIMCIVEITEKNNFKNIHKFMGISEKIESPNVNDSERNRVKSMLLSYAKDLVVAGKIELVNIGSEAKKLMTIYEAL